MIDYSKYDFVGPFREDGFAFVRLGDYCGLIDKTGKEIVPPNKYSNIGIFGENGLAEVVITVEKVVEDFEGNKYVFPEIKCGLINKEGQEIARPKYSGIGKFKNGVARFSIERSIEFGYINENGEELPNSEE